MMALLTGLGAFLTSSEVIKFLKQTALFLLVISGLTLLTNNLILDEMTSILTSFFVVLRELVAPFDFFINTGLMFRLLSYAITFQIGLWLFRAYISITHFFNER